MNALMNEQRYIRKGSGIENDNYYGLPSPALNTIIPLQNNRIFCASARNLWFIN